MDSAFVRGPSPPVSCSHRYLRCLWPVRGRPLEAWGITPELISIHAHWDGRTVLCTGPRCPYCARDQRQKLAFFAGVFFPSLNDIGILTLGSAGASSLLAAAEDAGGLRGLHFSARRIGLAAYGLVEITTLSYQPDRAMIAAFDVLPHVRRYLNLGPDADISQGWLDSPQIDPNAAPTDDTQDSQEIPL